MQRRNFIKTAGIAGAAMAATQAGAANISLNQFPVVRTPIGKRHFISKSVDDAISTFKKNVKDPELTWLFENCFPNTLDTTVHYSLKNGRPDTYVITGDIDAMWLRDSSAQVFPYLQFVNKDKALNNLIAGVINRQTTYILKDPYANAFYGDPNKKGEWATDFTDMKPGVHERKWEIDSLCYPIRLAHHYWKATGYTAPFNEQWLKAIQLIYKTFVQQQVKNGPGPYHFQRETPKATDTRPMKGYGFPVRPNGLICSAFRPSDDATIFSYLVPSNYFAVTSLHQAAEMVNTISKQPALAAQLTALANEVQAALNKHAVVTHPKHGEIIPFEVDGYGNAMLMDDSNAPSLLSLPYLEGLPTSSKLYQNTRSFALSADNPYYYSGTAAAGIGGPHVGENYIWHMSIIMQALTSTSADEIRQCIQTLKKTHGGTGFMHEGFNKDNPKDFTRAWFAWTNTLFGELLWHTYNTRPQLLTV